MFTLALAYKSGPVRLAQAPRIGGLTMYRRLHFGRLVRMHVLDTRSYRSQQLCETPAGRACRKRDDTTSTVLGSAQEAWLGAGLRNRACWNLIAQQVRMMPIIRRDADGIRLPAPPDSWSGYPTARARLLQAIRDNGLTNVVVASGDSHVHNIGHLPLRDDELDGPAAAVEFLGTSISSGATVGRTVKSGAFCCATTHTSSSTTSSAVISSLTSPRMNGAQTSRCLTRRRRLEACSARWRVFGCTRIRRSSVSIGYPKNFNGRARCIAVALIRGSGMAGLGNGRRSTVRIHFLKAALRSQSGGLKTAAALCRSKVSAFRSKTQQLCRSARDSRRHLKAVSDIRIRLIRPKTKTTGLFSPHGRVRVRGRRKP
ncbi:hypothetical protein EB810_08535 [Altererythrobacter sp. FM1]|nr:hypothetical protein EB810_08535 [Altererythrobacter sp. FM1]